MIDKELSEDRSIDSTRLDQNDKYIYFSDISNDSNQYVDKCLGPKDLIFRIPLQIENWFLSLDKESQKKSIKHFEFILKNNQ